MSHGIFGEECMNVSERDSALNDNLATYGTIIWRPSRVVQGSMRSKSAFLEPELGVPCTIGTITWRAVHGDLSASLSCADSLDVRCWPDCRRDNLY